MANSIVNQSNEGSALATIPRSYKIWVLGLLGSATLLVALGLWLASAVPGVVQPWTGEAFVVALGLAAIVGASKTSSA
jgi:hypothetical protein